MRLFTRPEFCRIPFLLLPWERSAVMSRVFKLGQDTCQTPMCPNTIYAKGYCTRCYFYCGLREEEMPEPIPVPECKRKGCTAIPQGDVPVETRALPQSCLRRRIYAGGSNDENPFPWAWRWFRSNFRASVSARSEAVLLARFRHFPSRLLGSSVP